MSSFFSFLSTVMTCMTIFGVAFMVVLALPQSRMRDVMKRVLFAIACAIYVLSPIDFMPEILFGPLGFVDDLGAIAAGLISVKQAISLSTSPRS